MKKTSTDNSTATTTTQTVRIGGVRTRLTTRNGRVTAKPALPLEADCQAAQVRALRAMPEYQRQFLLAADMNAERRGPRARQMALATGMTAGEPDLRIYGKGGRLLLIENKVGNPTTGRGGRLSPAQVERHAALARLGHTVTVLRATTTDDAAAQAVQMVRGWLAGNSNQQEDEITLAS